MAPALEAGVRFAVRALERVRRAFDHVDSVVARSFSIGNQRELQHEAAEDLARVALRIGAEAHEARVQLIREAYRASHGEPPTTPR